MKRTRPFTLAAGMVFALAAMSCSPATPATTSPTPARAPGGAGAGGPGARAGAGADAEPAPKKYDDVIKGDVITKEGLFKAHRIGSKLFFEIPDAQLGKDLLLVTQIAKTNEGDGYGGQSMDERVVRWERQGNRVLFRSVSYAIVSDPSAPIARAVESANYDAILASFDVASYGPDSAAVIDVSKLFTAPPPEISITRRYRGQLDANRSFLERVAAYPENVEVEATLTLNASPTPQSFLPGFPPSNPPPGTPPTTKSFVVHWSMVKLPEQPMQPRLRDSRVGYFFTSTVDFSRPEQRAQERNFISRYRLEKKNPSAAISDPVKPIEYYVDPATPTWLVPWVKAGIEEWQSAFEAAGFSNAIVARDAPTIEEDPDWAPEDARYSVVRWLPSGIENAVGPSIVDPRSGEILEADVQMYHNIMTLQTWWYWTQVGALDPRAAKLPLPDSLQGRLVQFVVAHEVGHTLGLPHNQAASGMYPADSVRSATWVARMGHAPSIMDYSRFNYVAQPEDNIALNDLIPRVGPYDQFAVKWGYMPIPSASNADEERATLDALAREQDTVPWYRYGIPDDFGAFPYTSYSEAVGDADAVKSTELGIRNLKRLVPMLAPATTSPTEDVSLMREGYGRLLGQFRNEMRHVATIVGSSVGQEKYGSQPGARFTPVSRERQRQAVQFVHDNMFETPTWLLDAEILRRLEPDGAIARINSTQRSILQTMLDDDRMARLVEYEALATGNERPYSLGEYLGDLRSGLFSELTAGSVRVDAFRRGLQRTYLALVADKLAAEPSTRPRLSSSAQTGQFVTASARGLTDTKAMLRQEVRTLDSQLAAAQRKVPSSDANTRAHLADLRWQIEQILNPE